MWGAPKRDAGTGKAAVTMNETRRARGETPPRSGCGLSVAASFCFARAEPGYGASPGRSFET